MKIQLLFYLFSAIIVLSEGFTLSPQIHLHKSKCSRNISNRKNINGYIRNCKSCKNAVMPMSYFSLDRSVLPPTLPFYAKIIFMTFSAVFTFFMKSFFDTIPVADSAKSVKDVVGSGALFLKKDLIPGFSRLSKVLAAKSAAFLENISETVNRVFDINPPEEMEIKDWQQCILDERELLPGGYIRYRFSLENKNAVLPLYMGQEVTLCTMDSSGRAYKESFFPVSPPSARGYFDIVLQRYGDSTRDKFSKSLDTMALGDELAIRAGKYRLNYQGEDDPVRYTSMVASGLGITTAVQMLQGVLPGKDTTVEEVELVWVNEEKTDFFCSKEVEALEYRYIEKLKVTRVIQSDLFGKDITENEKVVDAISDYEPGRIGVVCGPDYVVSRLRTLFQDLGYPADNILSVIVP